MKLLKFFFPLLLVCDVMACVCMLTLSYRNNSAHGRNINGANRSNLSIQTHAATSQTSNRGKNFF